MKIIHSKQDEIHIKIYRCQSKATSSNRRFKDQLSKTDILNCLKRFEFKCAYCRVNLPANKWQLDHFNPRALGGKNVIENICPCCQWCNTMKNALDGWGFIHRCKVISSINLFEQIGLIPDGYLKNKFWIK